MSYLKRKQAKEISKWVKNNKEDLIALEPNRQYLKIPREVKEQAKLLGVRWDGLLCMWWIPSSADKETLEALKKYFI